MNEQHVLSSLERYLDGDLSPAAAAALASHVRECRGCRAELERARAVRAALAAAAAPPLARSIYPGVAARLSRRAAAGTGPASARRPGWGFAGAAAAALLAGLLAGARLGQTDGANAAEPALLATEGSALLAGGGDPTLDDIYLDLGADPGGTEEWP